MSRFAVMPPKRLVMPEMESKLTTSIPRPGAA
jgi:hypothetical protein